MSDSHRRKRERSRRADNYDSNSNSSSHSSYNGDSLCFRPVSSLNTFANDGSFLEKFKKMQEEAAAQASASESSEKDERQNEDDATTSKKRALPFVGKRRGGKVLKTGIVEKPKTVEEEEPAPKDAWARYLAEVRKYREMSCDDEEKTRPLVK